MPDMMEDRWFKLLSFVILGMIVAITLSNVIYYNRLRKQACDDFTQTEATSLFWLNIITLVIASLLLLWITARLLIHRGIKEANKHNREKVEEAKELGELPIIEENDIPMREFTPKSSHQRSSIPNVGTGLLTRSASKARSMPY